MDKYEQKKYINKKLKLENDRNIDREFKKKKKNHLVYHLW